MIRGEKQDVSAKDATVRTRFRLTGIFLLIAGLFAAALIYRRGITDDARGAVGYEVEGGNSYAIKLSESKGSLYQLEVIGGKSNVIAAEFEDWFISLWHGRKLAYTLAFLSVGGGVACFFLARVLPYPLPPDPSTDVTN